MMILSIGKFLSDSLGMLFEFGWLLNFIAQTHVKNKISIFGSQEIGSVLQTKSYSTILNDFRSKNSKSLGIQPSYTVYTVYYTE